jgi:hypothetical protein
VWSVFLEAKTWRRTPSELFSIDDPYVAYCLDEAVAMIGGWITGELEKVEGKTQKAVEVRREFVLKRLLTKGSGARFQTPTPTK